MLETLQKKELPLNACKKCARGGRSVEPRPGPEIAVSVVAELISVRAGLPRLPWM
jgi:xanthine/CO dehydrogenase XdhC/CoxF family maturation factor